MFDLAGHRSKLDEVVEFFQKDIAGLRTGRATPSLVEQIPVEAYEAKTPLMQVASITTPDPATIVIQPWDKSLLRAIEKGIAAADINISPVVESDIVRLSMPQLTEENRREIVKQLHQRQEQARIRLRQEREKIKSAILKAEESSEINEDERFQAQKKLDEYIREFGDSLKKISDSKEQEIMTL